MEKLFPFWSKSVQEVLVAVKSSPEGLSATEAKSRSSSIPPVKSEFIRDLSLFASQFKNPLTLLLVFAVVLSIVLGEYRESALIFGILFLSAMLSFIQERRASRAAEQLRKMLQSKSRVQRDHAIVELPIDQIVPGDLVLLEAGAMVPADALILEEEDLYVNE